MLAITRKPGQSVQIGDALVTVTKSSKGRVSLTIQAPPSIKILRTELADDYKIAHDAQDDHDRRDRLDTLPRCG